MKNNHYRIGIVGDDVTGSNDIGIMYTANGLVTNVFSYTSPGMDKFDGDVIIIDTDSRFVPAPIAYERVFEATKKLAEMGVEYFYNKTCSAFRGNIGAEFDAMLDALGEDFAPVVVGFPDNGRTTLNSVHYIKGTRLGESEFKNDPMNPMTESNLVDILQKQTKRKVGAINFNIIDRGTEALKDELARLSKEFNYVILDVRDNDDLDKIAAVLKGERVVCGASALGKYLGKYFHPYSKIELKAPGAVPGLGIFSISGSVTPQTRAQIEYARGNGTHVIEMDTIRLLKDGLDNGQKEIVEGISSEAAGQIKKGKNVLVYASNSPDEIRATKELGSSLGMTESQVSKAVSGSLSAISKRVTDMTGQNRVLVAGGDTSASFYAAYGIVGLSIFKEIAPGVPSCISLSDPEMFLVLKSGSFGRDDFFIKAYQHLKAY